MALINESKNKGVSLLDLVMTGEAARICAVDRRTFIAKAEKYKIKPAAEPEGRSLYYRKDVEYLARKIREEKQGGYGKALSLILVLLLSSCTQYKKLIGQEDGDGVVGYDTWIGAGQSNSVQPLNGGSPVYSTTGMVELIYEHEGHVPQFTCPTSQTPFSHNAAWVRLADNIASITGRKQRIVNVGFGNTSTRRWQPYIPQLVEAVQKYNPSKVLWVQGESDFFENITADEAYRNMRNIIDATRAVNPNLIWYVALDGLIGAPHSREQSGVRIAQRRLIAEGIVKQGPDIDEMRWDHPEWFGGSAFLEQLTEFVGDVGHEAHANAWFKVLKNRL